MTGQSFWKVLRKRQTSKEASTQVVLELDGFKKPPKLSLTKIQYDKDPLPIVGTTGATKDHELAV